MIFWTDVSNNNWGAKTLTAAGTAALYKFLPLVKPAGFSGLIHKMSQGSTFIDPYGALAQNDCASYALPFMGYHWVTMDDPGSQVQCWTSAGGRENVYFDFEDVDLNGNPTLTMDQFWAVVNAFNAEGINVSAAYIPAWYANRIGADLSPLAGNQIQLVNSNYSNGYGFYAAGWQPYCGATPIGLQWTDNFAVGPFNVDSNAFRSKPFGMV
jgi:hypothetical protein